MRRGCGILVYAQCNWNERVVSSLRHGTVVGVGVGVGGGLSGSVFQRGYQRQKGSNQR